MRAYQFFIFHERGEITRYKKLCFKIVTFLLFPVVNLKKVIFSL